MTILSTVHPSMRRAISGLWIACSLAGPLAQSSSFQSSSAESRAGDTAEQAAIQRAKSILVSSMDRSLPNVSLEYFLRYESRGATISWEVNDCGEQTGNPTTDRGRDFPVCVEADFDVDHRAVSVVVSVGTVKTGATANAALFSATITDTGGERHLLKQLGELPMALHRPMRRQPRDLSDPARAV